MSNFTFFCPHCNQKIEADESMRGEIANCPCCNEEIVVDELSPLEEEFVSSEEKNNLPDTPDVESEMSQNEDEAEEKSLVTPVLPPLPSSLFSSAIDNEVETKKNISCKNNNNGCLIFILVAIFILLIAMGVAFVIYQQKQIENKKQEEINKRLSSFLVYGHELQKKSGIGVSYSEFGDLIAKIDSQWRIFCEITPKNHPGRSSIDKAIKTWTVCHEIWALKIKNIGSYKSDKLDNDDLSYEAETFLKTEVYPFESYSLPYKPYDNWISILLELASLHYQRGYILLSGKEKANIEKTKKLAEDALDRCIKKMPDQVSAKIAMEITLAKDKDEELLWTYIFAMGRYDIEHK